MEKTELVRQAAHIVQRACAFSEKSKREGLLSLEGDIDKPEKERRDTFEYGMRFVIDGTAPDVIQGILSALAAQEPDEQARRLKEMQKEAVLGIQAGDSPRMLLRALMSHIDTAESVPLREALAGIFKAFPYEGFESPDKEEKDFPEQAAQAIALLLGFSEKARKEGLLALEGDLKNTDEGFLKEGLRMVLDGTEAGIIDKILSSRLSLEQDGKARRLKAMQKEAVLGIKDGDNPHMLLRKLLSRINNEELETVRKLLPNTDTFNNVLGTINDKNAKQANKKKKEFLEQVAHTVTKLLEFCWKSLREGLLVLEDELEDIDDEFLKSGLSLMIDGTDNEIIDGLLSNRIALEQDDDARRLKTIQKVAVLGIQAGDRPRVLLHMLMSLIDNSELEALWKAHPDMFKDIPGTSQDAPDKFPCGGIETTEEEVTGFVKRLARIVRRACEFSDTARGKGLLGLKKAIDESKVERRDIFEYGSQFVADGWADASQLDTLLSNLIAHDCDEETRRLKIIQKEAVLGIQAGDNTRMLLHTLLSRIDNSELNALRRTFSYTYISEEFPGGNGTEPDGEEKGFAQRLARIARRACEFSKKARKEGLLALDAVIDEEKAEGRDIFEYGIQLLVNGTDCDVIRKILSNMSSLERDYDTRRLMEIQREAVLCIHEKLHPIEFLHVLMSRVTNGELEALRETAADIFRAFRYEGTELAGAEEAEGKAMVPAKSFWILKNLQDSLEESLGSEKAIDIASRLALCLLEGETPALAKEITGSIFMFEDILMLDDRSIQKVLRAADTWELATALRGVDAAVQNRIFRNMSKRAVAILKDRIGHIEPAKQKNDEETQARCLEAFEDIVILDDKSIQRLLVELDAGELSKALRNADPPVQEKIFKNMPKRTASTLKREIESMGPTKRKDVEEAQQKIISIIRHLEGAGEIVVARPDASCDVVIARPIGSDVKEARQNIISLIRHLEDSGEIAIAITKREGEMTA